MTLDEEMSSFEDSITYWLHWERGVLTRDSLPSKCKWCCSGKQTCYMRGWVWYEWLLVIIDNSLSYLHVRILLHRPTFLRFCRELVFENSRSTSQETSSQRNRNFWSKINMQSSGACIVDVIDLTRLLDDATRTGCDGAWWYTIFCEQVL